MHHHRNHCDPEWRLAGRRGFGGHNHGFGPFGSHFRGGRGGGFRVGRMLAEGDLRLIVLALLADTPRHGYDIIKALEELSSGGYSPSPGVVYPTLTFLEEAGFATVASEGNKKVYSITDDGRAHLADNRELADAALDSIERFGRKVARMRRWWEGEERDQPRGRQRDRDIEGVIPEVNAARRALKAAIAEKLDASEDGQRRLAEILEEAAKTIREDVASGEPEDGVDLG